MSEQFTTRLQHQLHEAALREERRSPLGSRLAGVRNGLPGPRALATAAVAAALVLAIVVAGGLDWGREETTVGPRVIADVPLSENLGQLASGYGSVWASDRQGGILRVDPRTRTVRQRIQVGGNANAPGGNPLVNAGAGAVWALAQPLSLDGSSRVLRIDPQSGKVTARRRLERPGGKPFAAADVQIIGGVPYVIGVQGVLELDPGSGRSVRFIKIERPAGEPFPLWLTGDQDSLWLLARDQRILRYGLESGRVEATIPVRMSATVAVIPTRGGLVLIAPDGELALADRETGRIRWRRRPGNAVTVPLVRGDDLYLHAADVDGGRDRLVVLDLRSGEVRSSTDLPEFGIAGSTPVGEELWLATPGGHVQILTR